MEYVRVAQRSVRIYFRCAICIIFSFIGPITGAHAALHTKPLNYISPRIPSNAISLCLQPPMKQHSLIPRLPQPFAPRYSLRCLPYPGLAASPLACVETACLTTQQLLRGFLPQIPSFSILSTQQHGTSGIYRPVQCFFAVSNLISH